MRNYSYELQREAVAEGRDNCNASVLMGEMYEIYYNNRDLRSNTCSYLVFIRVSNEISYNGIPANFYKTYFCSIPAVHNHEILYIPWNSGCRNSAFDGIPYSAEFRMPAE